MPTWNPDQYLKFMGERTQPSVDLTARIEIENPKSIIDIGCGPGNSTLVLRRKWNEAQLFGLDSSPEMIDKARADMPDIEWTVGDATNFEFERGYDVVFSNAALQWMQHHETLVPRLFAVVNHGGALAVQVPANQDSAIQKAIVEISITSRWSENLAGIDRRMVHFPAEYYYNILSKMSSGLDLWETTYYHILNSPRDLVEWYKGTGMRPYLERLPDDQSRSEFENEVLRECQNSYLPQKNGKVLFPFKRIFFVAYKG